MGIQWLGRVAGETLERLNNLGFVMIKDDIEKLRTQLNKMLGTKNADNKEILKVSQELDILIIQYYKEIMVNKEKACIE